MRTIASWLTVLGTVLLLTPPPARACECEDLDLTTRLERTHDVLRVRIDREYQSDATYRRFIVSLLDVYKGCELEQSAIQLVVERRAQSCLPLLWRGRELLVFGTIQVSRSKFVLLEPCSGTVAFSSVSAKERALLAERGARCPSECGFACPTDTCAQTSCDVAGATCHVDACDCTPTWVDAAGVRVCGDQAISCDYTDPRRDYVARSLSACRRLQYSCAEQTGTFLNECGCGCEQLPEVATP